MQTNFYARIIAGWTIPDIPAPVGHYSSWHEYKGLPCCTPKAWR